MSDGNSGSYRDLARAGITTFVLVAVATGYGITSKDFGGDGNAKAASDNTPTTVTETVTATLAAMTPQSTTVPTPSNTSETTSPTPTTTSETASPTPTTTSETPSPTSTTTSASPTPTPPPPTSGANQPPPLAEPVTSGRVKLTLNAVSSPPTVPLLFNRYQKDNPFKSSPFAQFRQTPPQVGYKFVRVDTTIENVGSEPFGLTCNLPMYVGVLDPQQQKFDAIPDLYRIKGNPECDQELQPGQSSPMSFVFEVPKDVVIGAFGFQDVAIQAYDPTLVRF